MLNVLYCAGLIKRNLCGDFYSVRQTYFSWQGIWILIHHLLITSAEYSPLSVGWVRKICQQTFHLFKTRVYDTKNSFCKSYFLSRITRNMEWIKGKTKVRNCVAFIIKSSCWFDERSRGLIHIASLVFFVHSLSHMICVIYIYIYIYIYLCVCVCVPIHVWLCVCVSVLQWQFSYVRPRLNESLIVQICVSVRFVVGPIADEVSGFCQNIDRTVRWSCCSFFHGQDTFNHFSPLQMVFLFYFIKDALIKSKFSVYTLLWCTRVLNVWLNLKFFLCSAFLFWKFHTHR